MIDIKELSIGSYVDVDGYIAKITEVDYWEHNSISNIQYKDVQESYKKAYTDHIKPIEVTERVLLDCGFTRSALFNNRYQINYKWVQLNTDNLFYLHSHNNNGITFNNNGITLNKSLHTLQNFYKTCFNIDIEYKPTIEEKYEPKLKPGDIIYIKNNDFKIGALNSMCEKYYIIIDIIHNSHKKTKLYGVSPQSNSNILTFDENKIYNILCKETDEMIFNNNKDNENE